MNDIEATVLFLSWALFAIMTGSGLMVGTGKYVSDEDRKNSSILLFIASLAAIVICYSSHTWFELKLFASIGVLGSFLFVNGKYWISFIGVIQLYKFKRRKYKTTKFLGRYIVQHNDILGIGSTKKDAIKDLEEQRSVAPVKYDRCYHCKEDLRYYHIGNMRTGLCPRCADRVRSMVERREMYAYS